MQVGEMRLCEATVKTASLGSNQYTGAPVVVITLKDEEKVAFGKLTWRNRGKLLALTLNGDVISSPRIEEAIYEGVFEVGGPDKAILERVVSAALGVC